MKFKVGDKVVCIEDWIPYGTKGEIITVLDDSADDHPIEVIFEFEIFPFGDKKEAGRTWVTEESLELEYIFNSPLYKALS